LRTLQSLAVQQDLEAFLVTHEVVRSFRLENPGCMEVARLVDQLRTRPAWTPAQAAEVMGRMNTLYPTATQLWRACEPEKER
jgi:hypothetical protein